MSLGPSIVPQPQTRIPIVSILAVDQVVQGLLTSSNHFESKLSRVVLSGARAYKASETVYRLCDRSFSVLDARQQPPNQSIGKDDGMRRRRQPGAGGVLSAGGRRSCAALPRPPGVDHALEAARCAVTITCLT